MLDITLSQAIDILARVCLAFSVLNAILPPFDVFNDFPKFQKYYKLFLVIVRYFAGDLRRKIIELYPSYKASDVGIANTKEEIKEITADIKEKIEIVKDKTAEVKDASKE